MAQATQETIIVAWHDSRNGPYQVYAAMNANGTWASSAQNGSDVRVTSTQADCLFPRLASDSQGNVRLVYEDFRNAAPWIYMDTYFAAAQQWTSSATGANDLPITPASSSQNLFPAIAIDQAGGVDVAWQSQISGVFQIFSSYCPSTAQSTVVCQAPLCSAPTAALATSAAVIDCATGETISFSDTGDVCLKITAAPGTTYFRVANESGSFTNWTPFTPTASLDTMVIPWTLSSGNGNKTVCVQVQDATDVGFPVCVSLSLQALLPTFAIAFFLDGTLSATLPTFNGRPVAAAGDVFVTLTASTPLPSPPTFDIVSGSRETISNQQTVPLSQFSGTSGFSGSSGTSGFSGASGATQFVGKFTVPKSDGFFHVDGLARLVPHGVTASGQEF